MQVPGKIMDVTPEALGSSNIQWIYVHDDSVVVWRQKTPRKYAGADSVNYVQHLSEQIWISGGTAATTRLLSHFDKNVDIDGNGTNTQFAFPVSWNGKLYFRADNGVNGVELCVSDLTTEGTVAGTGFKSGYRCKLAGRFCGVQRISLF